MNAATIAAPDQTPVVVHQAPQLVLAAMASGFDVAEALSLLAAQRQDAERFALLLGSFAN